MPHRNKMTVWPEIRCQRGHDKHETVDVDVNLQTTHRYSDFPQVPKDMAVEFDMNVWDPVTYPVDGGPYCPAHDAVSATILSHGIWEPRETILALHAFQSVLPGTAVFLDMGAQMGWFSLLAQALSVDVVAWECDPDNGDLLRRNWELNYVGMIPRLDVVTARIGPDAPAIEADIGDRRICLAKLDLEGAERDAVRMLWPSIEAGLVDHMLIEISPVFDTYYGDLVVELTEFFDVYMLPPKGESLHGFDGSVGSMTPWSIAPEVPQRLESAFRDRLRHRVNSWHQEDLWFVRRP